MAAVTNLAKPRTLTDLNAMPPATEKATSAQPHVSSGGGGEESKGNPSAVAENTTDVVESGAVTDIQKRMKRAERFGMPINFSEEEKRNSRAERFGTGSTVGASNTLNQSEASKRKARAERFGTLPATSVDEEAKKKARLERFRPSAPADTAEEDKKKARALRFSKPDSKENGKENIKAKTEVPERDLGGA